MSRTVLSLANARAAGSASSTAPTCNASARQSVGLLRTMAISAGSTARPCAATMREMLSLSVSPAIAFQKGAAMPSGKASMYVGDRQNQ